MFRKPRERQATLAGGAETLDRWLASRNPLLSTQAVRELARGQRLDEPSLRSMLEAADGYSRAVLQFTALPGMPSTWAPGFSGRLSTLTSLRAAKQTTGAPQLLRCSPRSFSRRKLPSRSPTRYRCAAMAGYSPRPRLLTSPTCAKPSLS